MARFAVVKMENKSGGLWAPAKEPRALGVCERSKTETVLRWIQPKMAIVAKSTIVEFLLEGVSQSTQFPFLWGKGRVITDACMPKLQPNDGFVRKYWFKKHDSPRAFFYASLAPTAAKLISHGVVVCFSTDFV